MQNLDQLVVSANSRRRFTRPRDGKSSAVHQGASDARHDCRHVVFARLRWRPDELAAEPSPGFPAVAMTFHLRYLPMLVSAGGLGRHASDVWALVGEAWERFRKVRSDLLAAALAFYALLSIAPLVIISVAVAGWILGKGEAQNEVTRLMADMISPTAAETVNEWVRQASASGGVASLIGAALSMYGASRLSALLHCDRSSPRVASYFALRSNVRQVLLRMHVGSPSCPTEHSGGRNSPRSAGGQSCGTRAARR